MEQVIPRLYVGSDADVPEAKKRGYARLTAAKDGPDGHREILGYTTRSAPHGPNYLFAVDEGGNHAAMNLIDVEDYEMIPEKMLLQGIAFAQEKWAEGKKILIHCNAGHSRGPTTAFLFMRSIGELPQPFNRARKIFKTLYSPWDPGHGMLYMAHKMWNEIENKQIAPKG
jgi:hypothetical protein